ncbi:unnamed protein product, partial [marine sediment metagenome]
EAPAPWTPIVKEASSIECWGRKYEFEKNLFPTQITSAGQKLLSRPIILGATIDGKEVTASEAILTWTSITESCAEFSAKAMLERVPLTVTSRLEYDGFLWTELTVSAKPAAAISRLYLDIPMRVESSMLMNGRPSAGQVVLSGKTHAFKSKLNAKAYCWFGNEMAGLQWSTGDVRDWDNANRLNTLELIPNGTTENIFRVNFIDSPTYLDKQLQFTVGLQATPVKPLPGQRRRWDLCLNRVRPFEGRPGWSFYLSGWNADGKMTDGHYGYQVPGSHWEGLWQSLKAQHQEPWIYWHMHGMWRGAPVYRGFRSEWSDIGSPTPLDPQKAPPLAVQWICRESTSFRDFAVWRVWKSFKDTPSLMSEVAGFYNDCAQASRWCASRTHGCGREDESGMIQRTYELLGTRELQKRFYVMVKNELGGKLIANHQSGDVQMSQLAFADMMVTGEHLTNIAGIMKDKSYYNVLSPENLRAEYAAQPWGLPMVFLPEIGQGRIQA